MKTSEYTYGGTVNLKGLQIIKLRGQRQGRIMRDKTKYSRKEKYRSRYE